MPIPRQSGSFARTRRQMPSNGVFLTRCIENADNVALMCASHPVEALSGKGQAYAGRLKNGIDKSTEILRGVAAAR